MFSLEGGGAPQVPVCGGGVPLETKHSSYGIIIFEKIILTNRFSLEDKLSLVFIIFF